MRILVALALLFAVQVAAAPAAQAQSRITVGDPVNGRLATSDRRDAQRRYRDEYRLSGRAGDSLAILLSGSPRMVLSVEGSGLSRSIAVQGRGSLDVELPASGTYRITVTGAARGVTGAYELVVLQAPPLPLAPPPAPVVPAFPDIPRAELRRFTLLENERYGPAGDNLPFGVILLKQGDTQRNQALCESYVSNIGQGGGDAPGTPVIATYWLLTRDVGAAGQSNCQTLLASYDFTRAARIMGEYGHQGAGPVLLALQIEANKAQPDVFLLDMSRQSTERVREMIGDWYNAIRSGVSEPRRPRNWWERVIRVLGGALDFVRGRACRLVDEVSGEVRGGLRFVDSELNLSGTILRLAEGNQIVAVSSGLVRRICGRGGEERNQGATTTSGSTSAPRSPGTTPPASARATGTELPLIEQGTLSATDLRLPQDQSFYDEYFVVLRAGRPVTIDLVSTAFDPVLLVFRGEELVAQNDDANGGSNAQIVFTPPADGTYRILANSFRAGETGEYQLIARPNN